MEEQRSASQHYGSQEPTSAGAPGERKSSFTGDPEVEEWAERERRRRQAWLEGPSEAEKLAFARRQARRRAEQDPRVKGIGVTDDEVEEWAERERRRRQAWLEGPSEAEKLAFARQPRTGRSRLDDCEDDDFFRGPDFGDRERERFRRDLQLARMGAVYSFFDFPARRFSRLVRMGREYEEEFGRPVQRRRILLED